MHTIDRLVGDPDDVAEVYDTIIDVLRRFEVPGPAVLGLSGGADSGVLAALAVDAYGPEGVRGIALPGPYSSPGALTDAAETAQLLGIDFDVVSIVEAYDTLIVTLYGRDGDPGVFDGTFPGVAEENIQARLRATELMAVTNKCGGFVLNTSNASELAVGYGTLYGDLIGALSPFAEVFKSGPAGVWALGREANRRAGRAVVPESTLTKEPSAELAPGQKDRHALPAYEILDRIVAAATWVTSDPGEIAELVALPRQCVESVLARSAANAFKGAQVPPGVSLAGTTLGRVRAEALAVRR